MLIEQPGDFSFAFVTFARLESDVGDQKLAVRSEDERARHAEQLILRGEHPLWVVENFKLHWDVAEKAFRSRSFAIDIYTKNDEALILIPLLH